MQSETSSPAVRLVGIDRSNDRHVLRWREISTSMSREYREKRAPDQENCEEIRYNVVL